MPWGVDDTFHLKDDPNPFDNIGDPPPSVLALTAIPNLLYNNPDWRVKYATRLKEILDTAWDEDELLVTVDEMAAIVRQHAVPEVANGAADDTERVRKFILKRKGEILSDLIPEPPDWPAPEAAAAQSSGPAGSIQMTFQTTWGSNLSPNPFEEGALISLSLNEVEEAVEGVAVLAGYSSPDEKLLLPDVEQTASLVVLQVDDDGGLTGMTLVVALDLLAPGATLVIGDGTIAGGVWSIPAGAATPDSFTPFTQGQLELSEAGSRTGAVIAGSFSGMYGPYGPDTRTDTGTAPVNIGLVINEVAAKGGPIDWFELHNASDNPIALDRFLVADDLSDAAKRVPFPVGTTIQPGLYLQFQLDKDSWPGFALGGDEELGIWLPDGTLVDSVDWNEGQSGEAQSYARLPDLIGEFQTVTSPTPGAPNQP